MGAWARSVDLTPEELAIIQPGYTQGDLSLLACLYMLIYFCPVLSFVPALFGFIGLALSAADGTPAATSEWLLAPLAVPHIVVGPILLIDGLWGFLDNRSECLVLPYVFYVLFCLIVGIVCLVLLTSEVDTTGMETETPKATLWIAAWLTFAAGLVLFCLTTMVCMVLARQSAREMEERRKARYEKAWPPAIDETPERPPKGAAEAPGDRLGASGDAGGDGDLDGALSRSEDALYNLEGDAYKLFSTCSDEMGHEHNQPRPPATVVMCANQGGMEADSVQTTTASPSPAQQCSPFADSPKH